MSDDGGRVIDQQIVELLTIVPDGWSLVTSIGNYSPWVQVGELLVKSLGLTKAYDISQAYRRLQLFLFAILDIFIIDSSTRGDKQ
jgi:hypothetical protein